MVNCLFPIFWHVYKNAKESPPRRTLLTILRTYFLTGLVVTAPIFITFYLVLWFVEILDNWFTPWIPLQYRPRSYLPIGFPARAGAGACRADQIFGGLTANFLGRTLLSFSDRVIPGNAGSWFGLHRAQADISDRHARRRPVFASRAD
ncbi:MAG: hypothetical protein CM15mP21_8330 [Hyphomicrobiales bacterium]|nr:MAG: hypothetical protein CM15mP21_8330 [Hyphomicrobiales bacterium]